MQSIRCLELKGNIEKIDLDREKTNRVFALPILLPVLRACFVPHIIAMPAETDLVSRAGHEIGEKTDAGQADHDGSELRSIFTLHASVLLELEDAQEKNRVLAEITGILPISVEWSKHVQTWSFSRRAICFCKE